MRRVHLIGRRNHGKTTLVVALVEELSRRGVQVGTIKHSGHDHELDTPGKDSWAHGQAGASPSAIVTPKASAIFQRRVKGASLYDALEPVYGALDIVLVEGDVESDAPKVEVWRAVHEQPPLSPGVPGVVAVITDDPLDTDLPIWPRADVAGLADRLLAIAQSETSIPPPTGRKSGIL